MQYKDKTPKGVLMMKGTMRHFAAFFLFAALIGYGVQAFSHCEIPCGIYDDAARSKMIAEHARTIEKSMNSIKDLMDKAGKDVESQNQLTRWIMNKEDHANQMQEILTQYFMTQRIKPIPVEVTEEVHDDMKKLALLHGMLVEAMKCKQTVDVKHVENIRAHLVEFEKLYFGQVLEEHKDLSEGMPRMHEEHSHDGHSHGGDSHQH
jgi:nickel superoxide dismutase